MGWVACKPALAIILAASLLVGTPFRAAAQDSRPTTDTQFTMEQISELQQWLRDEANWEKWNQKWGNRVLSHPVRHRPRYPDWLPAECAQLLGGNGLLVDACGRLSEASEDPTTASIRKATVAQRNVQENVKTRFIERVHFGAGWPLLQAAGFKYGGLFESHVSIAHLGRVAFNLPGVMILSLPDESGRRLLTFGTDLTVSFRLGDFQVPGFKQPLVLHMNIANAWTPTTGAAAFGFDSRSSLVGLSVTVKHS